MYVAPLLLCQLALAAANMIDVGRPSINYKLLKKNFEAFKAKYGKVYTSKAEEDLRMNILATNKLTIDLHNERYKQGLETYTMAVNKFGDLKRHEFLESHTLSRRNYSIPYFTKSTLWKTYYPLKYPTDQSAIDWRKLGAVTPVRDQKECGASYAYAFAGVVEANDFIRNHKLHTLAVEEIIHCSTDEGNEGCEAGHAEFSFQYMLNARGIQTEKDFIENNRSCCHNRRRVTVGGEPDYNVYSVRFEEAKLTNYLETFGPIATRIDASKLQFYESGIFYDAMCSNKEEDLNLEVLVVGFDAADGVPYYIVKNSWGSDWGEEGYVRMARGRDNHCGIATRATGTVVVSPDYKLSRQRQRDRYNKAKLNKKKSDL